MSLDTESRGATSTRGGTTRTHYTTKRSGVVVGAAVTVNRLAAMLRHAIVTAAKWLSKTITPAGWVAVVAVVAGLIVGVFFGLIEFVVAGLIAAVALLIAIPFLFGARAYQVHLQLSTEHVVAGTEVDGVVMVTNPEPRTALPARIDLPVGEGLLEIHVPLLRAEQQYPYPVRVPAYRRGVIQVGPATTVRADPLGLLQRDISWAERTELFVHPVTTALPSTSTGFIRDLEGNPSSHIVDTDISFHAIREYMPGDAQRLIHWKSTAHTGKLMVRQFEESRRSLMAVVLSLRDDEYANPDEFELAVSAAGSLGVRALRDGRDVAVTVGAEIPEFARRSVRAVRELRVITQRTLLDDLSLVESHPRTMPLKDVGAMVSEKSSQISLAFIVFGSTVPLKAIETAALTFPGDVAVAAVVCNPEAEPGISVLGQLTVITIGILDDLRQLLLRGTP